MLANHVFGGGKGDIAAAHEADAAEESAIDHVVHTGHAFDAPSRREEPPPAPKRTRKPEPASAHAPASDEPRPSGALRKALAGMRQDQPATPVNN